MKQKETVLVVVEGLQELTLSSSRNLQCIFWEIENGSPGKSRVPRKGIRENIPCAIQNLRLWNGKSRFLSGSEKENMN